MNTDFAFLQPTRLLWLCALLPFFWMLLATERMRLARLAKLRIVETENYKRIFLPLILAALTIVALSRPYWGFKETEITARGRDVLALVDVSKSMLTRDVAPNRLEHAKHKLLDLVQIMSSKTGDRLGLVLFAGEAYLFCPITSDYAVLRQFISSISADLIQSSGSSIEAAIEEARRSFSTVKAAEPMLLLVSDGEDPGLSAKDLAVPLNESHIIVSALGIGTLEGKPIDQIGNGDFVKDRSGKIVISRLAEEPLKELSEKTGGIYRRSEPGPADLIAILQAAQAEELQEGTRNIRTYNELGPLILICLLICTGLLVYLNPAAVITVILLCLPSLSRADGYEAAEAYKRGDYAAAAEGFSKLIEKDPKRADLHQSLGSSLFRLNKYTEAAKEFTAAEKLAQSGREKFEALYNLGNSYLAAKDSKQAIAAYEAALKIKPKDEKTEFNLELAKKVPPPTPTPTPSPTPTPEPTPSPSPSPSPTPSPSASPTPSPSGSESPTPSPDPEASPTPGKEDQKPDEAKETKEMSKEEAKAWLESLSDFPLLMRRQKGDRNRDPNEQYW